MICKTKEEYQKCLDEAINAQRKQSDHFNQRLEFVRRLGMPSFDDPWEKWDENVRLIDEWDNDNPRPPDPEWPIGPNEHYFESSYGCPVHHYGYGDDERQCTCRAYFAEDVSEKACREDHDESKCIAHGCACARK